TCEHAPPVKVLRFGTEDDSTTVTFDGDLLTAGVVFRLKRDDGRVLTPLEEMSDHLDHYPDGWPKANGRIAVGVVASPAGPLAEIAPYLAQLERQAAVDVLAITALPTPEWHATVTLLRYHACAAPLDPKWRQLAATTPDARWGDVIDSGIPVFSQ